MLSRYHLRARCFDTAAIPVLAAQFGQANTSPDLSARTDRKRSVSAGSTLFEFIGIEKNTLSRVIDLLAAEDSPQSNRPRECNREATKQYQRLSSP